MRQLTYTDVRGIIENAKVHPNIKTAIFSCTLRAPLGFRTVIAGHAMLSMLAPGDHWPARGTTVPVELSHVHVAAAYRSYGYATAMVKRCLAYAARRHWPVVLRITPYGRGRGALNADELMAWYGRMGFRLVEKTGGTAYMSLG